ncbi:MAG TPA: hypothetical protein VGM26_03755 [Rhizomicrobium sp.]|jgi:hypothetical protein
MPSATGIYVDTKLFGVRVVLSGDDPLILQAAASLFTDGHDNTGCALSVTLHLRAYDVNHPTEDAMEVTSSCLRLVQGGMIGYADGVRGEGRCEYPADGSGEDAFASVVEALLLFLVAHAGRIPLHASAVMFGETAIILAGRSGMGKSTLALTADRMGLPILSDDTIYVEAVPLCIWAAPRAIHVFEKDAPAGTTGTMRFRSGRWKRALPVTRPRRVAKRSLLCVLERGGIARLTPMDGTGAVAALTAMPEPGYEFYGDRSAMAIRALAADGCWRLTLSHDPSAAIALLTQAFNSLGEVVPA